MICIYVQSIILLLFLNLVATNSLNMNNLGNLFRGSSSQSKTSSNNGNKEVIFSKYDWITLENHLLSLPYVQEMERQKILREKGICEGVQPDGKTTLRLFDAQESDVRVTFYGDKAMWCPYSSKVWMLLEEKKIPHRIDRVNMRSYGDKPDSFLAKVPRGLLPAVEIDGKIQTESLDIMFNLEKLFPSPKYLQMWPSEDDEELLQKAIYCMRLERQLFSEWCGLVFRPSIGPGGGRARQTFEMTMDLVDKELGKTDGPWFLGGESPSIVDLQYITHVERMAASVPYWKGFKIRGDGRFPNIDKWFLAFEERPAYMATKSDYYTHVQDIPPQYGPGFSSPEAKKMADEIDGKDGSWELPLKKLSMNDIEPMDSSLDTHDAAIEAAWNLLCNKEAVKKFALRGDGQPGRKQFSAPLADPYATSNMNLDDQMDAILRIVISAMMTNNTNDMKFDVIPEDGVTKAALERCIDYLRDRIGVPRDMTYQAARQLRAHLNWAKKQL